jgi:hypothetical protein
MQVVSHQSKQQFAPAVERGLAAAGIAALGAGAAALWYFDPTKVAFLPACPLYSTTGFACPGCGMTRGFHALFHGDAVTAVDYNALIPIFVLIFGYFFISLVLFAVRGRGLPTSGLRPGWLFVLLGVMVVFGVVRNLPYYPFSVLFP